MDGWLGTLTNALSMPPWALGVLIALIGIHSLVRLYLLVLTVRTAIRDGDPEQALKVLDKLLRWFPFRR
jgi:hypothetical protein